MKSRTEFTRTRGTLAATVVAAVAALTATDGALAQSAIRNGGEIVVGPDGRVVWDGPIPDVAEGGDITETLGLGGALPAILLTGYWPPTNEMLRRFSPDPVKNPMGWIGANWEGRGYDVYAYFPEFVPPNCGNCGPGFGDLTVDYQDTVADFFAITDAIRPVGLVTFSRGFPDLSWEIEMNQYNRALWVGDYIAPTQPTPAPPDASVPAGTLRLSKLPVTEIRDAVNAAGLGLVSNICFAGDGGGFLSEFIAYLGVWYQSMHADPADPSHCVTAGHVHVGGQVSWPTATLAAEVTLREVIAQIDGLYPPETIAAFGRGAVDAGCGPAEAVLFANGSSGGFSRTISLAVGDPLSLTMTEPSAQQGDGRASRLCLFGWARAPGPADAVEVPGGYGRMCFGFANFATKSPVRTWNSIGREKLLGMDDAPGAPPTIPDSGQTTIFSAPNGRPMAIDLTFQGIVQDACSQGAYPFSVTNAILVRIGP